MKNIREEIKKRVLVLDGAMGTMIQRYKLKEEEFRGTQFADFHMPLKGCNDLLCMTKPEVITTIHNEFLEAGADIICTNTFNSTSISLADYALEAYVKQLNKEAALVAQACVAEYSTDEKPRFVAGSIGPTNKTASISPDVNDPAARGVTYDELVVAYSEQLEGLLEGGIDMILIETIFDTLNAKAALLAVDNVQQAHGTDLPVMISVTVADTGGRTLSGQTIKAFYNSIAHANPFSVGTNCSFGAEALKKYVKELSDISTCYISAHPNAGLPNVMGDYDQTPEMMGANVGSYMDDQLVNIIGGCCGSSPEHIAMIAKGAAKATPRPIPELDLQSTVTGLEPYEIRPESNYTNVGERCNVAGSRKFLRLINEKKYEEALEIARSQVENGAQIIDVNMDDAMLDAKEEMVIFLNMLMSEPEVSRVPIMIDSSKWEVIEAGLKCVQGKAIVNSISIKEGEAEFIAKAKKIKQYGAAAVVMAFDEKGQADTFERKIQICEKAYKLLTEQVNFNPRDIIFDPNVLAIATGIEQHNNYGVDFINTVKWIKKNLPHALISGGISNISFS
ncbi:MAG: homocysteine S-methyltransferase family protein, partial [Bacteroidales bacterium]|nr:homocysteine S-methyltransferase family protein [Bacteroidales bacterium]